MSLNSSAFVPEGDSTYERILDYGTWVKAIRQFDDRLPKDAQGVMDEVIEAFKLAEDRICDLSSERSHLFTIMMTASDVLEKLPHAALSRNQYRSLGDFLHTLHEAYEVIEFGDDREEKSYLPPRPAWR